jgi:hypothetical protein
MRVALFLVVMLALFPAAARAGTYDVQLCTDPAASGFTAANGAPGTFDMTAVCPPPLAGDGVYVGVKTTGSGTGPGTFAGWTVTAPPATTFAAFTAQRRLRKSDAAYEIAVRDANNSIVDGCWIGTCGEEVANRSYLPSRSFSFGIRCVAGGGARVAGGREGHRHRRRPRRANRPAAGRSRRLDALRGGDLRGGGQHGHPDGLDSGR